ncbi:ATP binding [Pyrenophora seminiperda CCB06]|uniref:ATP binding n=1 Tax=Pyrenophora seminiperda CCB06 TaxID=1302712 RepID=A0A3M7LZS2_9PLEO|nr:ATP binding [Pyrenophora seminiperda CCB06]
MLFGFPHRSVDVIKVVIGERLRHENIKGPRSSLHIVPILNLISNIAFTTHPVVQDLQKQVGTPEFKATQTSVLAIQQKGIDIRANNQKLAASINSPASAGLATVAGAQVMEMTQVKGLKNAAADDNATLTTLVKEVQDGTKQNQKNEADAKTTKC